MKLENLFEGYSDFIELVPTEIREESDAFLSVNCPHAYNSELTIFRGMPQWSHGYLMLGDSSKHIRTSANTDNYYTILMDHILPEWKPYPKRSKSFICTNNTYTASSYGVCYRVFPVGDPVIGICSKADLWASFQNLDLMDFEYMFRDFAKICKLPQEDSYNNIKKIIATMNTVWKNKDGSYDYEKAYIFKSLLQHSWKKITMDMLNKFDSFFLFLEWLLSPDRNNFDFMKLSEATKLNDQHELWFSGPAYFRELSSLSKF